MSPAPLTIDADANLMEAVYAMLQNETGRLAVVGDGEGPWHYPQAGFVV